MAESKSDVLGYEVNLSGLAKIEHTAEIADVISSVAKTIGALSLPNSINLQMSLKNHPDPVKTELEIVRPISEHSRVFVRVEELQGEELLKHLSRLGEIIRNKRIEMGLTQKQVGDSVGRASSYICNIERAFTALGRDDIRHEHSRPPVEIVLGLATTLELDAGATLSAVGYTLVKEEVE